jgi:ATP-binding cassette, subfamily B, bacterial
VLNLRPLAMAFGADVRRHWRLLSLSYVARVFAVAAVIVTPWPIKILIDHVLAGRAPGRFAGVRLPASPGLLIVELTGAFLLVGLIGALANAWEKTLNAIVRERLTFELRDRLLMHLLTLSPSMRATHRSGELVLRLVDDTDLFVRVLTKTVPQLFQNGLTLVGTIVMMFCLDARLALVACLCLPVVGIVLRRDARRLWAASREKRMREGEVCGLAQEVIRGMAVIQASGNERPTRASFCTINQRRVLAGRRETGVAVSLERSMQIVQAVATTVTAAGGGWLVLRGRISVGDLTLLTVYIGQLFKPVEKLNDLAETTGRGMAGGERLLHLLDLAPAVSNLPGAVTVRHARGVIELRNVSFEYAERPQPVLRGVSLRLEPGELTALVGPSGAGKSTLFSLIVRLFDPSSGEVLLDGRPLPTITLESLRAQFAVLSQDTHLFAGTLRQALTPADRPTSEPMLWEALALVAMDEFVRALPEGLDTAIGEDALNLSGGQRRRIALARAFLLKRPILLLDEPLANIDAASAEVILAALDRMRRTQTCFAVTHETALIERADRVCRLHDGRIHESPRWSRAAGYGS